MTNSKCSKEFLYLPPKAKFDNGPPPSLRASDSDSTSDKDAPNHPGTFLECTSALTSKFIPVVTSLESKAHANFVNAQRARTVKGRARIA